MQTIQTARPRNVNFLRAAGILYGDWGTSKAYVLGLSFALAGYSSFWFILLVSLLTMLVAINYIKICKFFPKGGGVYASVRNRSKVLSLIGAFFLISDYLVTAALSAVSAFHYLGVPHPAIWAISSIILIGMLNFFGPKHTGSLSIILAVPTILVVIILSLLSIPHIPTAIHHLQPMSENLGTNWIIFVGVIVALSGIESIANTTGSMKLDPGSTEENPSVVKTSTPAILLVMVEVCVFTTLFGLVMNALPGLEISDGTVNAPGYPNVRDSMLRYMGEVFGSSQFGPIAGYYIGLAVSIVFSFLLLSAVNTAMIALISLFFVMSRDGEMPSFFQNLNRFGVPHYSTLAAFMIPVFMLLVISDVAGLADLYAIGFVGAIAINLAATSTNFKLPLKTWERVLMLSTCIIMTLIEITLFIDKPHARGFVIAVIGIGLLLRALKMEQAEISVPIPEQTPAPTLEGNEKGAILVAVTGLGKSLDFALEETQTHKIPLYVLFIREQRIPTAWDDERQWYEDEGCRKVFDYVIEKSNTNPISFLYTVTAHSTHSIVEVAKQKEVSSVILGRKRGDVFNFIHSIRGTTTRSVSRRLPKDINLIVIY